MEGLVLCIRTGNFDEDVCNFVRLDLFAVLRRWILASNLRSVRVKDA